MSGGGKNKHDKVKKQPSEWGGIVDRVRGHGRDDNGTDECGLEVEEGGEVL